MTVRDQLGVSIGSLPTGPTNSVLDVPGVGVGHCTVTSDEPRVVRTGVTVLDPGGDCWASPVPAGVAVLNGAGELTGRTQVDEWGVVETPVFLTATMQVGRVYDAACRALMAEQPAIGVDDVIIPVVGECDDSWLSDPRALPVDDAHVAEALAAARASAGSGGRPDHVAPPPAGSCIGVVVTDAPVDHHGCERLAARVGLGLARAGSTATHGSGEIFLALATGLRVARGQSPSQAPLQGRDLNPLFEAVVDASEEAVLNSMLAARDTTGREGRVVPALPAERVRAILDGGTA